MLCAINWHWMTKGSRGYKENGGLSDARNAGIDIVEGDFLSFIAESAYVSRDGEVTFCVSPRRQCLTKEEAFKGCF